MASKLKITVNGLVHNVPDRASLDTPLLYVLKDDLRLRRAVGSAAGWRSAARARCWLEGKEISVVRPRRWAAVSRQSL